MCISLSSLSIEPSQCSYYIFYFCLWFDYEFFLKSFTILQGLHLLFIFFFFKAKIEGCDEDQFTCDNGHCISHVLVCNHEDDCEDSSDEKYCYFPKSKKKYENEENKTQGTSKDCQFLCPSDLKICLPSSGR